jgi:large subunit ribosomal protein L15
MKLHELKKVNTNSKSKRVGRGISAGGGKTAGRGTKGQKSRSGYNLPRKFEGGQTPLAMRLHKLPGFKSFQVKARIITLSDISKNYKTGEVVSSQTLAEKGMIKKGERAKILNSGQLSVSVKLDEKVAASKSALEIVNSKSKAQISNEAQNPKLK